MTTVIGLVASIPHNCVVIELKTEAGTLETLIANPDVPGFHEAINARVGDPITVEVKEFQATVPCPKKRFELVEIVGVPMDKLATIELALSHARVHVATVEAGMGTASLEANLSPQARSAYRIIQNGGSEGDARTAATRALLGFPRPEELEAETPPSACPGAMH